MSEAHARPDARRTAAHRPGDTLFIADLHLDASRPALTRLALDFVRHAHGTRALWILGDLFEAWLGDDLADPAHAPLVTALATLSHSGTALHLMHGNRDFLLGESFAARIGAQLHRDDEIVLALGDAEGGDADAVLLLHGDTLCTDDTDYQRMRDLLRDPGWQARFLAGSAEERLRTAAALRARSHEATSGKTHAIMDVAPRTVAATFARHGCATMIHGHTHRPADHRDAGDGRRRIVLGDWHDDHARYARHDGQTLTLDTWRHAGA